MIAIAAVPAAKSIRRSRRRRGTPLDSVVGAFDELCDRARDLGWSQRASETQREFGSRVFPDFGEDSAAGAQLVYITARALYGPVPPTGPDASAAWRTLPAAVASVTKRVPAWRRLVGLFDPRTLLPSINWLPRPLRSRPA